MVNEKLFEPVHMNGCDSCRGVIYRNGDGKLTYLSYIDNRRYGAGRLQFVGSEREFRRACIECPPDANESYTKVSKMWKPSWIKSYMTEREFVEQMIELQSYGQIPSMKS